MFLFVKYLSLSLFLNYLPYILMVIIFKYYFNKRRLFTLGSRLPGPRPWPLIGNALDFLPKNVDFVRKMTELNRKYGLTAHWIGHQLKIYISSPEDAEICFNSPHLQNKNESYEFFEPIVGEGLLTAKGMQFEKAKKAIEPAFNNLSIQKHLDVYIEKVRVLLQCLQKKEGNKPFLIYPYMKKCTFDIISETILPIRFNAQEERLEPLEQTEAILAYISERTFTAWEHSDMIYKFSAKGKDFFRKVNYLKKFFDSKIKESKAIYNKEKHILKGNEERMSTKQGLLKSLLEKDQFSDDELRDQVMTVIAGGFESTALTSSYILMMLGIHKEVQEKLYDEILTAFENGLREKDLYRLEYLEMVIKETLRLFPPLPYVGRKPDQDVLIGQHLIPKGANIVVNIFAIHRSPEVYGNPEAFNPDNFLPENIKKRHPYSYIPFAKGSRKCIGGKFAMMSLRVIIAKIVLNYKIDCDLNMEDIKLKSRIFLEPENGYIRILKR